MHRQAELGDVDFITGDYLAGNSLALIYVLYWIMLIYLQS